MKRIFKTILLLILLFILVGCKTKYPELEEDAIGFKTSSYTYENDDSYLTIEYNGRIYIPYGTGSAKEKDIDKCIGYIIQDENSSSVVDKNNKDTRVYTLTIDKDNNFLMEYYIGTTLMNPPTFYRAIDTKDKDINIPNYIEDLGYNYWKQNKTNEVINSVKITIDGKEYIINLEDNETTRAFVNLLPQEFNMNELNGNEKYVYLDASLPTNSYNPKKINSGDVMLFGNDCLVIFYKSFDTSYSYTKIGHIDNLPNLDSDSIVVKMENN